MSKKRTFFFAVFQNVPSNSSWHCHVLYFVHDVYKCEIIWWGFFSTMQEHVFSIRS